MRLLSLGYMIMTLTALFLQERTSLPGHYLYTLGSLYYALTAGFLLLQLRKYPLMLWLGLGVLSHLLLLLSGGYLCISCTLFATGHFIMTAIFLSSFYGKKLPAIGLLLLLMTLTTALLPHVVQAGEESIHYTLEVADEDGLKVPLDLRKKPALFVATWCPHCNQALLDVASLSPGKRPYVVFVGDLKEAGEKLAANNLAGEKFYLSQSLPVGIHSVPALVEWDGRKIEMGSINRR